MFRDQHRLCSLRLVRLYHRSEKTIILNLESFRMRYCFLSFSTPVRSADVCVSGEEQQGSGLQSGGRCRLQSGE